MTSPTDRELERLREICEATAPAEPEPEKWDSLFRRITAGLRPSRLVAAERRLIARRTVGTLAALAAAVLLAVILWPDENADWDGEVFPVATASEVQIISVAGADTNTLVVGEPPVKGMLELLAPGEMTVTSIQPSDRDIVRPQAGDRIPMIWARLDSELDD